ncbi:MAG TPA: class I SAM-dependent methyltransferase [Mycobacteriales bacterium]|nr:class I SAM-dependent methyltransferase [Mycobacteriales bacterium]
MTSDPTARALQQYGDTTRNLDRRVAIHSFGTSSESWPAFVRRHLPIEGDAVVLDVGAGTGVHWRAPSVVRPVLIDLHAPMCRRLVELGHPVLMASAEALPIASASVDGVLSTHVLYHVPDPSRAVSEMRRVLSSDGWIALATNGPRHMSTLDELRRSVGVTVDRSHHDRFGIADAVEALSKIGMRPVRHDYHDDLRVTDPDVVVGYCDSLGDDLTATQKHRVGEIVERAIAGAGCYRIVKETTLVIGHA